MIFEQQIHWAEKHPYWLAGGVGLLVVLYLAFRSGSSSGSTVAGYSGPSDAAVNAGAQVQIATLQANEQQNQLAAQLSAQNADISGQISLAQINAGVAHYQVEQQANVQQAGIAAQQSIQIAGINTQQVIALANDATQVQLQSLTEATRQAQINAVVQVTNAPYALQAKQLETLGPTGLAAVITQAEKTRGSQLNIGGITAGRAAVTGSSSPGFNFGGLLSGAASLIGVL